MVTSFMIGETKVVTLNLTDGQNDVVKKMLESDSKLFGNYALEDVDREMANVWVSDAFSEDDIEYAEALQKALACGADIYTLEDYLGEFHQTLGEVIVY